ncbi:hypothetical protein BaRGS_00029649, partial [Batillaria attramentaria]
MRSNTLRDINTRPNQEHVDQLCLSDPEWPVRSSGAPGTSSPGSECGCLPDPVIMLNLALLLLSLILFHVDVGWSQNTLPAKSREQLTKELHDLTIKFDQHLKTHTSAEDIQKMGQVLGEKMTAAIISLGDKLGEQLGEAVGDKLTEAIEKLGDKQVDGIQNLEHTLGEKLSDLTQKCQNS